jgi:hypothetical protein
MQRAWFVAALVGGCGGGLSPPAPAIGSPRWAVAIGDDGVNRAYAVAIDSDGSVIVIGGHNDPPNDPDPNAPTPIPVAGFIAKLSPNDGSTQWETRLRSSANGAVVPSGVALDETGAVYVTGVYVGTSDFGGQQLPAPMLEDTFLAKYAADGQLVWVRGLSSTAASSGTAITLDGMGHPVVLGSFLDGTLTLAGQSYTAPIEVVNGYLAAFDSNGTVVWGQGFTSAGDAPPSALARTSDGSVLITGTFTQPTSFGDILVTPPDLSAFVARVDATGAMLEARAVAASGATRTDGQSVAVSSTDVVFVQTLEEGHSVYPVPTLHALDLAWQEQWATFEPEEGFVEPPWQRALTVLPNGVATASAWIDSPFNADHPETVTGYASVVAYDVDGTPHESRIGSRSLGHVVATHVNGAAAGAQNGLALVGEFGGTINFGSVSLPARGDLDGFVVMIDPPKR